MGDKRAHDLHGKARRSRAKTRKRKAPRTWVTTSWQRILLQLHRAAPNEGFTQDDILEVVSSASLPMSRTTCLSQVRRLRLKGILETLSSGSLRLSEKGRLAIEDVNQTTA